MRKIGLSLIIGLVLATASAQAALAQVLFSPYVDITLSPYWDPKTEDLQPQDFSELTSQLQLPSLHLAFITDSGYCEPAWGGQKDYSIDGTYGREMIAKLKAEGVAVVISLGGALGTDISAHCEKTQLLDRLNQIADLYHPDGLDFDIENGTAKVDHLIKTLAIFQQEHPDIRVSLTLPVMPEGLTRDGKEIVTKARYAGLNFHVNIMAMDYGPSYSENMGDYAILAATSVFNFLKELYPDQTDYRLWSQIEVTPMIGVNDVNTEQFTLADARLLQQFALANQLGGLSMWSLNRDKPCQEKWANPYCSGNDLQTVDYEFVKSLL